MAALSHSSSVSSEHMQAVFSLRGLLRSALVTLVLSMIGATYRNWRFQFYLHANYVGQYLDAKMKATNGERDCVRSGAVILVDEAGASITIEDSNKRLTEEEKGLQKQIDKFKRQENRSFLVVHRLQNTLPWACSCWAW